MPADSEFAPRRATPPRVTPRYFAPRRATLLRAAPRYSAPRRATPRRATLLRAAPRYAVQGFGGVPSVLLISICSPSRRIVSSRVLPGRKLMS